MSIDQIYINKEKMITNQKNEKRGQNREAIIHKNTIEKIMKKVSSLTQAIRIKIAKPDQVRMKNFCSSKDIINRMKEQIIKWEIIFM